MVDKPKTYPQKVAELQEQLAAKDLEIEKLQSRVDSIPGLQEEIDKLKNAVPKPVDNKAQMVDLTQRAESAEAQNKSLNIQLSAAVAANQQLESQLDILAAERDKNLGKDRKIEQLSDELKRANLQIATANNAVNDVRREATEQIARMEKQLNSYQLLAQEQGKQLANVSAILREDSDTINKLRTSLYGR